MGQSRPTYYFYFRYFQAQILHKKLLALVGFQLGTSDLEGKYADHLTTTTARKKYFWSFKLPLTLLGHLWCPSGVASIVGRWNLSYIVEGDEGARICNDCQTNLETKFNEISVDQKCNIICYVNQPDSPNCVFTKNVDLFTSIKRTSRMDFYKNQMKG